MNNLTHLQNLPMFEPFGIGQRTSATNRNLRSRSHERRVNESRRQARWTALLFKAGSTIFIEPR
jgi:hypothetical protein